MKKTVLTALAAAFFAALPVVTTAATWDLYDDFSIVNNPNGQWAYGYSPSFAAGYAFSAFPDHFENPDVPGWWVNTGGEVPLLLDWTNAVAPNVAIPSLAGCTGPGSMHSDTLFEMNVVRWTAAEAGVYDVSASWQQLLGRDDLRGDWTCYVVVNGVAIFSAYKPDYWSVPTDPGIGYEPIPYAGQLALAAGDTLDFAVDSGPNGDYRADWFTVDATITTVPEPSSIIALLAGLGGLAGMIRRRS